MGHSSEGWELKVSPVREVDARHIGGQPREILWVISPSCKWAYRGNDHLIDLTNGDAFNLDLPVAALGWRYGRVQQAWFTNTSQLVMLLSGKAETNRCGIVVSNLDNGKDRVVGSVPGDSAYPAAFDPKTGIGFFFVWSKPWDEGGSAVPTLFSISPRTKFPLPKSDWPKSMAYWKDQKLSYRDGNYSVSQDLRTLAMDWMGGAGGARLEKKPRNLTFTTQEESKFHAHLLGNRIVAQGKETWKVFDWKRNAWSKERQGVLVGVSGDGMLVLELFGSRARLGKVAS